MEYSIDYLQEMLPSEMPSLEYVPIEVIREVESREIYEGPDAHNLLARSIFWTYAIFAELQLGNFRVLDRGAGLPLFPWLFGAFSGWSPLAVGLFDPKRERPGFGLAVNVPRAFEPGFRLLPELEFPRLKETFPFMLRTVTTELHAAPNPTNATTACWGKCDKTGQWGIITAGHAVGSTAGYPIALDDGSTGISHRCYWQPVDAAFVLTPAPTQPPTVLPIVNFPAAGLAVNIEAKTGAKGRSVVSACNSLGFYRTRQFPVNFFLDQPADPGDSGALVSLTTGEACGIYLGSQPSPDTGGTSGLTLNFAQAMFALDTSPYR